MFVVLANPQCKELQTNIIKISNRLLKEDVESGSNPYLELLNYGEALMLSADISFSRKTYLRKEETLQKKLRSA